MGSVKPKAPRRNAVKAERKPGERSSQRVVGERHGGGKEHSLTDNAERRENDAVILDRENGLEQRSGSAGTSASAQVGTPTRHESDSRRRTDLNESAPIRGAPDDAVETQRDRRRHVDPKGSWHNEDEETEKRHEHRKERRDFRRRKSAAGG